MLGGNRWSVYNHDNDRYYDWGFCIGCSDGGKGKCDNNESTTTLSLSKIYISCIKSLSRIY